MAQQKYTGSMFSPSVVAAEMRTVDNHIKIIVERLKDSDTDSVVKEAFAIFAGEWIQFYEDNDDIFHRSLNSVRMQVADYRNRLNSWQVALKKEGAVKDLPVISRVAESGEPRWPLMLAGAGATLLVGVWLWNATKT